MLTRRILFPLGIESCHVNPEGQICYHLWIETTGQSTFLFHLLLLRQVGDSALMRNHHPPLNRGAAWPWSSGVSGKVKREYIFLPMVTRGALPRVTMGTWVTWIFWNRGPRLRPGIDTLGAHDGKSMGCSCIWSRLGCYSVYPVPSTILPAWHSYSRRILEFEPHWCHKKVNMRWSSKNEHPVTMGMRKDVFPGTPHHG